MAKIWRRNLAASSQHALGTEWHLMFSSQAESMNTHQQPTFVCICKAAKPPLFAFSKSLKESTGQDQLEGFAFEGGNRHEKVKSLHDILCGEVTVLAGKLPGDSDVLEKTQDVFSYLVSFFSRIQFREPLNMFLFFVRPEEDITALLPAAAVHGIEKRRKQELDT